MRVANICIELGDALRPEELTNVERIEALVEQVIAVSLQAHFDLVVVKKVRLGAAYIDELPNDGACFFD